MVEEPKNNSFICKGKIIGDWIATNNPAYDEKYFIIQSTDNSGRYTNEVKILVNGTTCERANLSFLVSPDGLCVEVHGYINGRLYSDTGKHFQTLKASFIKIEKPVVREEPPKVVINQDMEYQNETTPDFDDDDLPF